MFYIFIYLLIGGRKMVDLYIALIVAGRRTLDDVPRKYKLAVKEDLEALGLDGNGNVQSFENKRNN